MNHICSKNSATTCPHCGKIIAPPPASAPYGERVFTEQMAKAMGFNPLHRKSNIDHWPLVSNENAWAFQEWFIRPFHESGFDCEGTQEVIIYDVRNGHCLGASLLPDGRWP